MRVPKGRFERLILKVGLWILIAIVAAFTVFLFGATWEVYQKEKYARGERSEAVSERTELLERKEELTADLESLTTERGMEAEFRKRFPVAKEGEEVIVLVDAKDVVVEAPEEPEKSIFETIKSWFGI